MKKRISLKLLAGITMLSAFAVIAGSVAWFIPLATVPVGENKVSGSSSGAYFAYGNGTPTTAEHPENRVYGITTARHLYNLAWLQYLGFFNLEAENGKQYYFELADNIDMTGWTLPPIGTEEHPFIGNFNGNGYVVDGLTVSNNFSDFERHPGVVTSADFDQPHILGFFGVIGDYNSGAGSDYSSAANEFSNTGLTGLTIKTYLKDSLMGIAAGYVDANMKNIEVDASTITLDSSISQPTTSYGGFTDNISDFSLVGYTTNKKQVRKVNETVYDVTVSSGHEFNATEQGEGATGWGGSIDMMSVTQRLQRIRDNYATKASNANPYYYKYTNVYHDGVLSQSESSSQRDTNNYTYLYNTNDEAGHFNFIRESQNEGNRYALMGGGHYESNTYYKSYNHSGSYITDGTNYLTIDNGVFINKTDSSEASLWNLPDSNGKIYTTWNGEQLYLRNNNGILTITNSESSGTNWTITTNGTTMQITNGNYKIAYYSGAWMLISSEGTTYYTFRNGQNYFGVRNNDGAITSVNNNNAAKWYVDGNGHYYYVQNGTSYYLGRYYSYSTSWWGGYNAGTAVQVCALSSNEIDEYFTYYTFDGTYFSTSGKVISGYSLNTSTFYIRYNQGWTSTTNTGNRTSITQTTGHDTIPNFNTYVLVNTINDVVEQTGPDEYLDRSEEGMNYKGNDVTYFPLSTINNTNNFAPADNNTAYVIGGSSTKSTTNSYGSTLTNVRFGYYPISDYIADDFNKSSGTFTHVYTINDSMQRVEITNSTDYEKLADAKTNLGGVMKGQTNVYGLHFMDAAISMNALTTANYVKVNKETHTNYQLPVNSIDFHLKEFGYINFMAGSYYHNSTSDRNDSFFALYQIERLDSSPNNINRIFEVLNIYKHSSGTKNYSYVYQLKDTVTGSIYYTKPYKVIDADGNKEWLYDTSTSYSNNQYETSLPQNYNLAFKVDRIKKNTTVSYNNFIDHVYYFEIPMNDGEFCLGSVSGATGSYLMYLDIGANASKHQRTIFTEHFSMTEILTSRPDGVALVSLPQTFTKEVAVLDLTTEYDYSDSACVRIIAGYTNSFTIDRNGGDVTLTRSNQSNAPPVFAGEEITLIHDSGSSTNISVTPISSETKDIKRLTYIDVNVNLGSATKTIITDTSINNGAATRTISQEVYSGTDLSVDPTTIYVYDGTTDQRDSMKIYNTTNGVRYSSDNLINQTTLPIGTVSNTAILTVTIIQNGGAGYEEEIVLNAIIDESNLDGKYYLYNDYVITITPDGADVVITVKSYSNGKVIYYGTTQVTGANQTITIEA